MRAWKWLTILALLPVLSLAGACGDDDDDDRNDVYASSDDDDDDDDVVFDDDVDDDSDDDEDDDADDDIDDDANDDLDDDVDDDADDDADDDIDDDADDDADDDVDDDADDDADDDTTTTTSMPATTSSTAATTTTTTTTATTTTQPPLLLWEDDFESYPTGDLKYMTIPWRVIGDYEYLDFRSIASITDRSDNRMLSIYGMDLQGFYVLVEYAFDGVANDFRLTFEVTPTGAADIFGLYINRRYGDVQLASIEFTLIDGRFMAEDHYLHQVDCGAAIEDNPNTIDIRARYLGTYDVLVNGVQGDCEGLVQHFTGSYPIDSIWVFDSAGDGQGGYVFFDNFAAYDL